MDRKYPDDLFVAMGRGLPVPVWERTAYLLVLATVAIGYSEKTFKAAVFEHSPPPVNKTTVVSRHDALAYMQRNLEAYRLVAEKAGRQASFIFSTRIYLKVS